MKKIFDCGLLSIFYSLILAGCATAPYQAPSVVQIPLLEGGIFHEVHRGDTLWRISKTYGIDLGDLLSVNNITDETIINPGQRIFIPGAKTALEVTGDQKKLFEKDVFLWPIEGSIISFFSQKRHGVKNKGIDIRARRGDKIFASKSGKVVFSDDHFKGHGNIIVIDHLDGFFTVYSRNSRNLVRVGDSVGQGQVIAFAGSAGKGSEAWLHFEIRRGHRPQNPLYYLP